MKRMVLILAVAALLLSACGSTAGSSEADYSGVLSDLITSAYSNSGSYSDSLGNKYSYSYSIPCINSRSDDAKRLNQTLLSKLQPVMDEELAAMEKEASLTVERIEYQVYLNGSIVSIVASIYYPSDYVDYCVVNFDAASETEAGTEAVLKYADIGAEQFSEAAISAVDKACRDSCGAQFSDSTCQKDYNRLLAKMHEKDYSATVFLDGDGKLCLVSDIVTQLGVYQGSLKIN